MKKYLIVLLSIALVFGFALSALADVKISGSLRVRGEYLKNPAFDTNNSLAYDSQAILKADVSVSENTKAVLTLISVSESTESSSYSGNIGFGSATWGSAGSQGVYPKGGTLLGGSQAGIGILDAYIQHTITSFGFPITLSIGHQPAKLGNGIFFDHSLLGDDKLAVIMAPTKELTIAVATLKFYEGSGSVNDDANAYVGLFAYKGKGYNMSGDITYVEDGSFATSSSSAAWTTYAKVFNYGIRGDMTFNNITVRGDLEVQSGKLGLGSELTASGNALLAGVDFKTDVATLTGEFASGSGDDGKDATKFKSFITALSNMPQYTYVYNYRVTGASKGTGFSSGKNTGLTNTQYIKGAVKGNLVKDLSGEVAGYLLTANQAVTLNGNATKSTNLGTEIDYKIAYNLDKGLIYYVEGGYLFVGDAYKNSAGTKPDNVFAIRNGLQLKF